MTIEPVVDWITVMPAAIKLACAITGLFLVVAYYGMRPGDPTL